MRGRAAALALALVACGERAPGPCPDGMARIAGGTVTLGSRRPHQPWHRPARAAVLETFCVDRYEFPGAKGEVPLARVTWEEAAARCEAAGKRLCTGDEWERACRGTDERLHPYGNDLDPSACNTPIDGSGPPAGEPPPVAPSGAFPGCVSPDGVFDLDGNLSEWVADPWTGAPEPFNREATVDPDTWRTLRGGTMWSHTFYGGDCTSAHGHHRTEFKNMDDGFRCCATP